LCFVFFLSGTSALLFETLWFRLAGLTLGNSVWASSLVLASFMGGLAAGNAAAARLGPRLRRPVRLYVVLELVIGSSGLFLVLLFPALTRILSPILSRFLDDPLVLNPLRLAIAFTLMLVPTTAMGATLPLLAKALSGGSVPFGQALGRLYGWNTLGGMAGALAGEGLLIGALGLRGTGYLAATLDALAALLAAWAARRIERSGAVHGTAPAAPAVRPRLVGMLAAASLAGGILLALEVVWFRFLALFVHATSFTFAVMLAVVLLGIALGGLLAAAWVRVQPLAHRFAPHVALLAGWFCVQAYVGFDRPPGPQLTAFAIDPWLVFQASLWLMLPVCLASGALFTLLGSGLGWELSEPARATGLLTLANTLGAMLGALLAGFVLLPGLGIERSIFVLALGYGGVALFCLRPALSSSRAVLGLAAAGLAYLLPLFLFPFGLMSHHYIPAVARPHMADGSRIVAVREGLTETAIYLRKDLWGRPLHYRLLTNGFSMSGTLPLARRYMKLFVYWPVALRPDPTRALLISYGVGSTAKALVDTRSLESIDVVDISRDILELSFVVYPVHGTNPLDDPRVRVHVEDGRFFLQTSRQQYDVITAEPPPPKNAGIVNLYSKEYFHLVKERLAEGGTATYWLPVFELEFRESLAIVSAFCSAFDDCSLWTGSGSEWMLAGTRHAAGASDVPAFERQWHDPVVAPEMRALGLERPEQLGALFIGDAPFLAGLTRDVPPLEDNYPHRLSPRAPVGDMSPYLALMDVAATRPRFEESALVKRLWPAPLRTRTLALFEDQSYFNDVAWGRRAPRPLPGLADLHRVLTHTSLRTLPVLMMGSSPDRLDIARAAAAEGREGPRLDFELGVAAMAERDYPRAAQLLERSLADHVPGDPAAGLAALAFGLGGEEDQVARLAQEAPDAVSAEPAAWTWLEKTFPSRQPPAD